MSSPISHDQNFKNLILDYSSQALEFFAAAEAEGLDGGARITPIRQEQLKSRLHAVSGLLELEPDPEKQLKYLDFIDIYAALDDNEMHEYQARYPQEQIKMAGLTERLLNEGMQKGLQKGMQQGRQEGRQEGEMNVLLRLLTRRFGPLDATTEQRLRQAGSDELERWADNILDAETLDEVFAHH